MRHARDDYARIQDPAVEDPSLLPEGGSPIGEDEPVFLLRAKDRLAPDIVKAYATSCRKAGRHDMADNAYRQGLAMARWQAENESKMPDLPK